MRRRLFAPAALACVLAACASAPTRFYSLTAVAPAVAPADGPSGLAPVHWTRCTCGRG